MLHDDSFLFAVPFLFSVSFLIEDHVTNVLIMHAYCCYGNCLLPLASFFSLSLAVGGLSIVFSMAPRRSIFSFLLSYGGTPKINGRGLLPSLAKLRLSRMRSRNTELLPQAHVLSRGFLF